MIEDFERTKEKQQSAMRKVIDYGRGLIFILIGSLFFFHDRLPLPVTDRIPGSVVKWMGGLFVLYGVWRVYQGYIRNRQK